jgi:hypothetical protein
VVQEVGKGDQGAGYRGDATGGGAVFSSDEPLYNRVLRKKLIGLLCGGCEGREIQYVVVGWPQETEPVVLKWPQETEPVVY